MSNLIRHPYHLVDESPWPLIRAIGGFFLTLGMVKWFHFHSISLFFCGLALLMLIKLQWWRDVRLEGTYLGLHSGIVELGLRWGIILFIVSEVFFFVSFFWAFYHRRLSPIVELGRMWPPLGINAFDPFQVPLLNTIVLLSSGGRVTWAHHSIIEGHYRDMVQGIRITILLGIYFTRLQGYEYYESSFSISDRAYGATFFVATGFHGLHVIVGTTFLFTCLLRHKKLHFSPNHHFGFEAAAWYWHFVDVVWLFLYVSIYWWGGL